MRRDSDGSTLKAAAVRLLEFDVVESLLDSEMQVIQFDVYNIRLF